MPRPRRRATTDKRETVNSVCPKHTVADCLLEVGVLARDFDGCESFDDEFRAVKKAYFAGELKGYFRYVDTVTSHMSLMLFFARCAVHSKKQAILENHPDKGGDAAQFRRIRTAFEVLRDLKVKGAVGSFTSHLQQNTNDYYETVFDHFASDINTPSYDHFYHAAQEDIPGYKVERARSGHSQCVACKSKRNRPPRKKRPRINAKMSQECHLSSASDPSTDLVIASISGASESPEFIPKDTIRVGSLDETSGSYGRWYHLECWRVPYRIWAGLTEPENPKQVLQDLLGMEDVLLSNLHTLSELEQTSFVAHTMDKTHWARKTAASKAPPHLGKNGTATSSVRTSPKAPETVSSNRSFHAGARSTANTDNSSTDIIQRNESREYFVIPRPGINGAIANLWENKKFVLTGVFPEVGGGKGLNLGKDRVRAMIESFGGSVTSSVSGKTSFLVVGKEPGKSKVSSAQRRGIPLIGLMHLQTHVLGQARALEEAAPPPLITSFSAGYQGAYLINR